MYHPQAIDSVKVRSQRCGLKTTRRNQAQAQDQGFVKLEGVAQKPQEVAESTHSIRLSAYTDYLTPWVKIIPARTLTDSVSGPDDSESGRCSLQDARDPVPFPVT